MKILESNLIGYSNDESYDLMVGSFSGVSNISGIVEKHDEITELQTTICDCGEK